MVPCSSEGGKPRLPFFRSVDKFYFRPYMSFEPQVAHTKKNLLNDSTSYQFSSAVLPQRFLAISRGYINRHCFCMNIVPHLEISGLVASAHSEDSDESL